MWLKFGWLIILPPGVGWDVMGYESDPLPSHLGLSSCSYYIMLSYAESTSTPQVHLPRPIPAISPSGSSLSSAPPQHRVHIWSNSSPLPLWLPAASWFNLLWCELPLIPLQSPPGSIPTPHPPHFIPSSPWSSLPPVDGTPPISLSYPPSQPISHLCIGALTVPPPYISSPRTAPLLPSLPAPSQSSPTTSAPSSGSGTPPPNRYYYRLLFTWVKGSSSTAVGPPHWSGMRP